MLIFSVDSSVWQYARKSLAEIADAADVGDRLTQIDWIYKIFLRKSAISARDCLIFACHDVEAYGNTPGGLSQKAQMQVRPPRTFV